MKIYRIASMSDEQFEEMWGFSRENDDFSRENDGFEAKKVVKVEPATTKDIVLTLYRGMDLELDNLRREGDYYILSPNKSEQQSIWFSQYIDDARGRGKYILTYPLMVKKHIQVKHLSDGFSYESTPEDLIEEDYTQDSKIWGGLELPEGWYWSYKVQKYPICKKEIKISQDMLRPDNSDD